ncbi:DEHA2A12936p [Debaryomyces hansenii CBS767]|uniref:Phosphatidylethanolamine N-methyltransferase n=1 Tax=Debaryomyces hansenii (strain ATCC 36239 / CBS 767 / BCRC 21394 / JCM 1990 / NBRC 0083 / IGC 2968) TaxID=284592 RepID=CHO2_DEBHA|nr:DEHA2A12936p [Debaryomyces hansenii CBS767]Q6BY28.2 RecName: Full=Phosphatidylethanolamine N-methyltransferase; Short=PE methyltransferase; Short=PEAMT; Short=PEMT [Debaryomyces hansenii CBS767]CAG84868.2 DEHA2A12936p [Debaryomyces hansenii CBS767]|eukprot:XP_456891.2 DEHA2A12936p [Debaryomyces hansenii CBS767]
MKETKVQNTIAGAKGITFSGDTFVVPETHDMVKTLFDPMVRKSYCEMIILLILAANGLVFWLINNNTLRIETFIGLYIFWRLSYNFGIGYLLNVQSNHHRLVKWARKAQVFKKNGSLVSRLAEKEIKSQMGPEYDVQKYPIEFNTWLLFRKVVDLILMSDFTTFICLVVVCAINKDYQFINSDQQEVWLISTRLILGTVLILFNLWVKVNAHNTIKDYAWYWGDFFFRQINNEDLIFDGVFEMVPHPMYSVGYVGYYGFAIISKSYTILTVAIFGHFLQMIFLHYIENPHIDKIYGPSGNEADIEMLLKLKDLRHFDNIKPLVGLLNFTWLRASDMTNLIMVGTYSFTIPYLASLVDTVRVGETGVNPGTILFILTIVIKVFESLSINILLILQSYYKTFTKWYLSNDISVEKTLNNWSIMYNSLISLTYSSFFGLNFYHVLIGLESDKLFINSWVYLRIFLGILLVFTQVWINSSIIDSIGYFGWFYGDFFIPKTSQQKAHLTKAGVYRYLNNPEQIFGVCGIMGVTLIIPSLENLICCVLWVTNNFIRINFIEKAHMIKIYGEREVMKDSGVTKTFKKHLIPGAIQRRLSKGSEDNSDLLNQHRRKSTIMAGATDSLDNFIKELKNTNTRLTKQNILELSQNLYFENSDYKLVIKNLNTTENNLSTAFIGEPIEVEWKAPENHSPKDWIGLYKTVQTTYSRYKTLISSSDRWTQVTSDSGSYVFEGEKLFWEEGIYEFRYHLDGKHDVAYISEPFELTSANIEVPPSTEGSIVLANELKAKVFDRAIVGFGSIDSPIDSAVQKSGSIIQTYNRLAYVISKSTGIHINAKVFLYADNEDELTVHKLSLKLINIRKVLDDLSHAHYPLSEEKKEE